MTVPPDDDDYEPGDLAKATPSKVTQRRSDDPSALIREGLATLAQVAAHERETRLAEIASDRETMLAEIKAEDNELARKHERLTGTRRTAAGIIVGVVAVFLTLVLTGHPTEATGIAALLTAAGAAAAAFSAGQKSKGDDD